MEYLPINLQITAVKKKEKQIPDLISTSELIDLHFITCIFAPVFFPQECSNQE